MHRFQTLPRLPALTPLIALLLSSAFLAAAFLAAASPAGAQPEDLDAWRSVTSPSFHLYSNAPPERAVEIAESLELFRGAFARLAPAIELDSPAPTKIYAFRDHAAFAPYKGRADGNGDRILGQFFTHPDGNYLALDAGTRLVGAFQVIYHEYVHYFVRHNFPGVPRWFNEGLAEYYSTFAVEDGSVVIGRPVERHLRWLERDAEFSLAEILEAGHGHTDVHGGEGAGRFYAVSWVLVHHLLSGDGERLDQMSDFLLLLADGEPPDDAFEDAFDLRLDALEETLRAYVLRGEFPVARFDVRDLAVDKSTKVRGAAPAEVLFHLGDLAVHLGRRESAERHFLLALDHDPDHPEAHAGLAHVRDLGGRFDEAEVLYRDAVERGSNDALTYLLYGRHFLRLMQTDGMTPELGAKARAAFARARELDPGFAEAEALFGVAHKIGDVDPAPGIAALRNTLKRLPDRFDLAFHLVDLHLIAGQFDAAASVLRSGLAGRAPEEQVAAAWERIERGRLLADFQKALEAGKTEHALELFDAAIEATSDEALRERMEAQLVELQEQLGEP